MSGVEPIHGPEIMPVQTLIGNGDNPFHLTLSQQAKAPIPIAEDFSEEQLSPTEKNYITLMEEDLQFDRLTRDQKYYRDVLRVLFFRARHFERFNQLDKAAHWYYKYFKILHTYGNTWHDFGIQAFGIQRYSAIFRFAMVLDNVSTLRVSEQFLNKELLNDIRSAHLDANIKQSEQRLVDQFIYQMQARHLLPSAEQKAIKIMPSTLTKLAKFYLSHGLQVPAQRIVAHLQIRHLRELARSEALLHRARPEAASQRKQDGLLLFPFEHLGVPLAPVLPRTAKDIKDRDPKIPSYPYYYTERVDPVFALNKDPNEDEKRRKREREVIEDIKKLKANEPDAYPHFESIVDFE